MRELASPKGVESVTQRVVDTDNGARESVTHGVESVTQRVVDTGNGEIESVTQGLESTKMRSAERKRHQKEVENSETGERVPLRARNLWLHARVSPQSPINWLADMIDMSWAWLGGLLSIDRKLPPRVITRNLLRFFRTLCACKSYRATVRGAGSIKLLAS